MLRRRLASDSWTVYAKSPGPRLLTPSKLTLVIVLMLAAFFATGCMSHSPRVVMVPPIVTDPDTLEPTDIVKLGPGIEGRIYVQTDEGWELSENELELPEGWFLIPPPPQQENDE